MARNMAQRRRSPAASENVGRDELVEIAIGLFSSQGYAGTSVRDIAAANNRSVSTVYHYFENKEAIWLAILENSVKVLPAELRGVLNRELNSLSAFQALVRRHLEVAEQFRREWRIFFIDDERLSPAGNKENRRIQKEILDIYLDALTRLQDAGLVKARDLRVTAFNTLGIINWYLRWSNVGVSTEARAETVDEIVAFIMRGITGD